MSQQQNLAAQESNERNFNNQTDYLSIGQIIYTDFYQLGRGVIYQIHGEQKPDSVRNNNNIIVSGGKASFDIVFYNGHKSNHLPESILRGGIQWKIKNEVVDNETIASLLKKAADCEQAKKNEEARENKIFNDGVEYQKNNLQYAHLTQLTSSTDSHIKVVGKNIRAELKRYFPKTKFSVRMSNYNCYNVSWVDGAKKEEVNSILSKFDSGRFDGYTDYHYTDESSFNVVYGSVQFLFLSRKCSDPAIQKCIDKYLETLSSSIDKSIITLENFKKGQLFNVGLESRPRGIQYELYELIGKTNFND